jgi:hypothetical protein
MIWDSKLMYGLWYRLLSLLRLLEVGVELGCRKMAE